MIVQFDRVVPCVVPDQVFEQAAKACLAGEGVQSPCAISLTLTDEAGIQRVNHQWRGLNRPTDVLSFPSVRLLPGSFSRGVPAVLHEVWDSDAGAFFLGDILICVPQAMRQAVQFHHTPQRELSYLFVHGILHLLGYDHLTKEDQAVMRKQEEAALNSAPVETISDSELLGLARAAREFAHTPYSNYRVGAALLADDGTVFTGCNIENASYGLTNCAERTAVFKAVSEGKTNFSAIAIAADQTAPWPCGACRQVMSEFAPNLRVLITWADGKTDSSTLDQLLPHGFFKFKEDHHG